ncbi:MAG: FkbM family methyltransferase [Candidatus Binatia bacterium]
MVSMHYSFRHIMSHMLVCYGYYLPYHRGKWRVVNGAIRAFRLQAALADPVTVKRNRLWFRLDTRYYLDRSLYYLGAHEGKDTRFVEAAVQPGWVVCDVGANIGWYTLSAAKLMGHAGWVHAFEPAAEEFERLQRNVLMNELPNVMLHQLAMSDCSGKVWLTGLRDAGSTRLATSENEAARLVGGTTLDTFVREARLNRLDLVKVDIEGAELKFLRGAQNSLGRFRPALVIELSLDNLARFGANPHEVIATLEDLGYVMYRSKWHGLHHLGELPGRGRFFNAVALPRESVSGGTLSWKEVREWAAARAP